jgi:hypothetical protein
MIDPQTSSSYLSQPLPRLQSMQEMPIQPLSLVPGGPNINAGTGHLFSLRLGLRGCSSLGLLRLGSRSGSLSGSGLSLRRGPEGLGGVSWRVEAWGEELLTKLSLKSCMIRVESL